MNILEVRNITKRFGGVTAVHDFSMDLKPGQITGIIGPNGAGKTTIFNLISGIYPVDEGNIKIEGRDVTRFSQEEIARSGIARTFQNIRLFKGLDVLDNVKAAFDYNARYSIFEALLHLKRVRDEEERIEKSAKNLLSIVKLEDFAGEKPENLSYGLQRRLEIARALALNPKVLMLDEPAAGLNPEEVFALIDFIREINSHFKLSILIIEHRMDLIMQLCEWIHVQDFGENIAQGTPEDIQQNEKVLAAYLGGENECFL